MVSNEMLIYDILKRYELTGDNDSNIGLVLSKIPEEVEKIIEFCRKNEIDYSLISNIWRRRFEEIEKITELSKKNGVSVQPFYNVELGGSEEYFNKDAIFKHTPEEVEKIIEFCKKNGISYMNQNVFKFHSLEEIVVGHNLCKKLGIDFSNFLGANDEFGKELWVMYNGTQYLLDDSGEKLLRCYNPKGDIAIPGFVKEIGDEAFSDCNDLHSIIIPNSVRRVGKGAFLNCKGLYEAIFEGDLSEIESSTFKGCSTFQRIKWPNNLKKIGREAFRGSSIGNRVQTFGIEDNYYFKIPDSVQIIEELAFCECENLTSFNAPKQLIEVRNEALKDCNNLSRIELSPKIKYFDPSFRQITKELTVWYGDWHMFAADSSLRVGYENYVQMAENIYDFCRYGLKKVLEEGQLETVYLPNYFEANTFSEFEDGYNRELVEIIAFCNKKDAYAKVFSKLNVTIFKQNAKYLVEKLGVKREEIPNLIVSGNHYNMLGISIDAAFNNYQYLCEQKLVSESILQKLYFGSDDIENKPKKPLENDEEKLEDYRNKLKDYYNKLLKDYYARYNELPELFNSLLIEHNDKNMLELRDRLTYVSTMHLLDSNFNYIQLENAKDKLKYSLLENIVNRDKVMFIDSNIYSVLEEKYPEMCGIMYSLRDKLMGIDVEWFDLLLKEIKKGGQDTVFDKFYRSLTMVRNWDKYDERERMTLLKNEIVGRLLYADIFLTCSEKTDKGCNDYLKNRGNNSLEELLKFASTGRDDLFFNSHRLIIGAQITGKDGAPVRDKEGKIKTLDVNVYSQIGFILTMLEIDPYSFDALRMAPGESSDVYQLENLFAIVAKEKGYLFSKEEKSRLYSGFSMMNKEKIIGRFAYYDSEKTGKSYTLNRELNDLLFNDVLKRFRRTNSQNIQKTFSEFMSNIIGTARIPRDMEGKYLDYVRESIHKYLYSKDSDDLYSLCSSLDLYLRSKSEYEIQSGNRDVESSARVVFDGASDISDDVRILYSLHNLNRLAHDVVEIDMKSVLDHRSRLNSTKANVEYKEFSSIITAYNDLFHIGFSQEDVMRIIDPRRTRFDKLKRDYEKFIVCVSNMTDDEKNNLNNDINYFEVQAADVLERIYDELDYKDSDIRIDYDVLKTIMSKLEIVKDRMYNADGTFKLSESDRELISDSVKTKSYFFEAKKMFAQELMRRMASEFSDGFLSMLSASDEEKVRFYAKNGYIAEVQYDEKGQDVLVCLCDKFNEPFSIHLKDMPVDIQNKLNNCTRSATIAYARLDRRGLTLRDNDFVEDIKDIAPTETKGFVEYEQLLNAIRANYDNYDLPASRLRLLNVLRKARDTIGTASTFNIGSNPQSNSELEGMLSEETNNTNGANTNTGGNKHQ